MKSLFTFIAVITLACNANAQIIYIDDSNKDGGDAEVSHFLYKSAPDYDMEPFEAGSVRLLPGLFKDRYELNRKYMTSLEASKLLQNFYAEAGLNKEFMVGKEGNIDDFYWGWESLSGQLRGHFLGHYLSAAAYITRQTDDKTLKNTADFIVDELYRCQEINGGEWVGSIPEKYMTLMAEGKPMWSPQYTLHKTLMGLYDMGTVGENPKALKILDRFANWFYRWTGKMIEEGNEAAIMNGETSGMLEIWADMYELAKNDSTIDRRKYHDLMYRYGKPWIFTLLAMGEDALSNDHCNASIPWSHGAARCYEVTGDKYWLELTKAFWKCATHDRELYCTGGQNAGEHWIPQGKLALFAGENNQEHCTVYNMMRTADFLYRWTGDLEYADFIERNLYNGILAQQHPVTGMVAYFLPMASGYKKGGEKGWGHPTMDFYCCHGSLVQAQNRYLQYIYFKHDDGVTVSQYIPSTLTCDIDGVKVRITQDFEANQWTKNWDGNRFKVLMKLQTDTTTRFALRLRLPWWLDKKAAITIDGSPIEVKDLHGYAIIDREWNDNEIVIDFPDRLWVEEMPGDANMVAIMEGPIVLASETAEFPLKLDKKNPSAMLRREMDQQYRTVRWQQSHYRTVGQEKTLRFKPLYEIGDESYTIYFPIK